MRLVLLGERSRSRDLRLIVLVALLALSLSILETLHPGTLAYLFAQIVQIAHVLLDYVFSVAVAIKEIFADIAKSIST